MDQLVMQPNGVLPMGCGLWPLDRIPKAAIAARHGFTVTDPWLDRVRLCSPRVGFGSGAFVSADGLIMTSQHVIRRYMADQQRERIDNEGFYASDLDDEFRCGPGLIVDQLVDVHDVTQQVTEAIGGSSGEREEVERCAMQQVERAWLRTLGPDLKRPIRADAVSAAGSRFQDDGSGAWSWACQVIRLDQGRCYHLHQYKCWTDVRVVFAHDQVARPFPGQPGNDPRYGFDYAFDVGFLRVWQDGVPAKTPDYFRLTTAGPSEGELLFVAGYPRDLCPPEARMRRTVAQIEHMGYTAGPLVAKKRAEEEALRRRIAQNPAWQAAYGSAWTVMAEAQDARRRMGDDPEQDPQAWQAQVATPERKAGEQIAEAWWRVLGDRIAPDPDWTLRLSDGVARGYLKNGRRVPPTVKLKHILDAVDQHACPLPPRWMEPQVHRKLQTLAETSLNLFLTANTYGGSSGSPVLTREGQVLGVVFGRNEDGECCGDIGVVDEVASRACAVHSAAIFAVLKAVYRAGSLLSELTGGYRRKTAL